MNHKRVINNLKDTIGIELVRVVTTSQNKYSATAIVKGCLYKSLKSSLSLNILITAINISPKSRGSVGKAISTPIGLYKPNSCKLVDSGVKKATAVNSNSTLNRPPAIVAIKKGMTSPQYFCSESK